MGLETATFINQLVDTNPTASDNANQGDNHLRLIKSALKATFPNITGAVTATQSQLNTAYLPLTGGTLTGGLTGTTATFSGNVTFGAAIVTGTGVSTGDAQLEIGGNRSGDGPAYMDLHGTAGGDFNARVFRGSGANGNMEIVNAGTGVLSLATNATEKMRIDASGNVGIGTSSPGAKLQINSQDGFRFDVESGAASTMRFGSALTGESTGALAWVRSAGAMTFSAGNTGSALTERMRIASNGFVGVGTSTDNGVDKLTVAGIVGSYISGRAGFHLYNGGATAEWFIGQPSASSHNLTFSKLVAGTYTDYVAIDSTGRVGIGTINPAVSLDVVGGIRARGGAPGALGVNNNGYSFDANGDTDGGMFSSADGQIEFYSNATERMRISSTGNVGIGTTSPTTALDVVGTVTATAFSGPLTGNVTGNVTGNAATATALQTARTINGVSFNGTANISFGTDSVAEGATNLYFTNARARSAISVTGAGSYNSTTGVITVNAAPVTSVAGKTGAVTLAIADVASLQSSLDGKLSTSGGSLSGNLSVTGTITATGDITAFSDARLKTNVETISEALYKVKSLRGVSFVSKLDHRERIGVIAQEVERVIPEAVTTHEHGMKSVAYGNLVGLLIEAIKDLEARVAELERR